MIVIVETISRHRLHDMRSAFEAEAYVQHRMRHWASKKQLAMIWFMDEPTGNVMIAYQEPEYTGPFVLPIKGAG